MTGVRVPAVEAVNALTNQLHMRYCVPGADPRRSWSEGHRRVDQVNAARMLEALVFAGWTLSKEQR